MADRPIIFSGPMVQALLSGRTTQTRRVLNPQPDAWAEAVEIAPYASEGGTYGRQGSLIQRTLDDRRQHGCGRVRYAQGDRLYVREAFNAFQFSQDGDDAWPVKVPTLQECKDAEALAHRYGAPQIVYRESDRAREWFAGQKWRPSIHMPRWASRITLTVTEVRVQRLQDISEAEAVAEGIEYFAGIESCGWVDYSNPAGFWLRDPRESYRTLWNSLHGPDAWDANPWVVAVSFTTEQRNIDQATP